VKRYRSQQIALAFEVQSPPKKDREVLHLCTKKRSKAVVSETGGLGMRKKKTKKKTGMGLDLLHFRKGLSLLGEKSNDVQGEIAA